jgi:hypothetical protein
MRSLRLPVINEGKRRLNAKGLSVTINMPLPKLSRVLENFQD